MLTRSFFSRLYLQFNSQANIQHGGTVELSFDQSYPYLDYFKTKPMSVLPHIFGETATDLEEQILALPLGQWEQVSKLRHQIHEQFEKAIVFNAMGDLYREGIDRIDHGSVIYRAGGLSNMERHTSWAGVFTGNDILVNAANLVMDEVRLSSPAGLVEAQARIAAQIKKLNLSWRRRCKDRSSRSIRDRTLKHFSTINYDCCPYHRYSRCPCSRFFKCDREKN